MTNYQLTYFVIPDYSVEPPIESTAYPVFVQSTDDDGNALGGIRHPLLTAPLATHASWSLRATGYGESDLFTIQGSMIPFAATEAERQRAGDPRPSLQTRYASRDAWRERDSNFRSHLVPLLSESDPPARNLVRSTRCVRANPGLPERC